MRVINAPVVICTTCKHSLAVCTCDSVDGFDPSRFNEFAVPDWAQIALDNTRSRITLVTERRDSDINATAAKMREREHMLKVIEESARKPRTSMQGKFAALTAEVFTAMSKLPKGKAIEYDFDKTQLEALKKDGVNNPIKGVVNSVRRKIKDGELPFDVYANDEKSFTVVREMTEK